MANTIHGVVRTDAMWATNSSAGLLSAKYFVDEEFAAIDNGNVVKAEALLEGERELFKAVAPAEGDDISKIFLVATPEVMYDERLRNLSDFYNEADQAIRLYPLHVGDMFSVSAEALDGEASVGATVGVQASTKLKVGGTGVGTIIAVEPVGSIKFAVIRVG